MSDEMSLFGGGNVMTQIEAMPSEVREALREQLNRRATEQAISMLRDQTEALRHELDRQRAETDARFDRIGEAVKDAVDAGARRFKHADRYYTRTVLGDMYAPQVSAKRMSKLMVVCGILSDRDTPYAEFQKGVEPMAKRKPWADYPTWIFHSEKVQTHIDRWLTDHGLYEEFHETSTKNQRDAFIDMVYEEHA